MHEPDWRISKASKYLWAATYLQKSKHIASTCIPITMTFKKREKKKKSKSGFINSYGNSSDHTFEPKEEVNNLR